MTRPTGFIAYPSEPTIVGQTIESASTASKRDPNSPLFTTWREIDIPGHFIANEVLSNISAQECFVADISVLNFNVTFEIGFAIGLGKRILLIRNKAIESGRKEIDELGIFDSIGWLSYENSEELAEILKQVKDNTPLTVHASPLNTKAPVYLLDAKHKIDPVVRIISRVKKAGLFFRSFDPNEQTRMSAPEVISEITQSFGVIVPLLPNGINDSRLHNLRGSFLAGLAEGMGKELVIIQLSENDPVPMDFRDLVKVCNNLDKINEVIAELAPNIFIAVQGDQLDNNANPRTLLESLSLGASAAENEFRDLSAYYVETDAYQRAYRGEVRIVLGRKGSGKTALFAQVRNKLRENKRNIIIDLKPESYKLLKFKEDVLQLLQEGTLEHTLMAFWEYILLLEICYKLLEKDRHRFMRDPDIYEAYQHLNHLYHSDEFVSEGDFSERMSKLLAAITSEFLSKYDNNSERRRLSNAEITELLYKHDIRELSKEIKNYLKHKDGVWLLIDNLDKGWPTYGVQTEDLIIIRTLIEASRKIERQLDSEKVTCRTLIFLRNDVFELLIDAMPDRGKESQVILDWTDADALREMLKRRFVYGGLSGSTNFYTLWNRVVVSHVDGEESSQFLIERSLMRPRALIDCIKTCKGFAVNRGHDRIDESDIKKGVEVYSKDMVREISLEIRDVFPAVTDAVYLFIGADPTFSHDFMTALFEQEGITSEHYEKLINLFLWYGVLGFISPQGEAHYIYDTSYDIKIMKGLPKVWKQNEPIYGINPAFWPALYIQTH